MVFSFMPGLARETSPGEVKGLPFSETDLERFLAAGERRKPGLLHGPTGGVPAEIVSAPAAGLFVADLGRIEHSWDGRGNEMLGRQC